MGEQEEKLLFTEGCQLINMEEMVQLGNHHFAAVNIIVSSDKDYYSS